MITADKMRVMVVDDDMELLKTLGCVLEKLGCEAQVFEDPRQALNTYSECVFDLVLTDLNMPVMSGLEVLKRIRKMNPQARVALITGCIGGEWETLAEHGGVFKIIRKPMNLSDLHSMLAETGSRGESQPTPDRVGLTGKNSGGRCEKGTRPAGYERIENGT